MDESGYRYATTTKDMLTNTGIPFAFANKSNESGYDLGVRSVRWDGSGAGVSELGNLGTDPFGYTDFGVYDINEFGVAVGTASRYDAAGNFLSYHPVTWDASGVPTIMEELGTDAFGNGDSYPVAINDLGNSIGESTVFDGSGNYRGLEVVRWNRAGLIEAVFDKVPSPSGARAARPVLLNNSNVAMGVVVSEPEEIVRWDSEGHITQLDGARLITNEYALYQLHALNNNGAAVATAKIFRGFGDIPRDMTLRWDSSSTAATELRGLERSDRSGFTVAFAFDINDGGTAIGTAGKYDASGNYLGTRTVRWNQMETVATEMGILMADPLGRSGAIAYAINEGGTAVGSASVYNAMYGYSEDRAVYWRRDGTPVDLNTLIDPQSGWTLITAYAISDSGWITGEGTFYSDGPAGQPVYERLFLIHVPEAGVPEPSTLMLAMCFAAGMYHLYCRRR